MIPKVYNAVVEPETRYGGGQETPESRTVMWPMVKWIRTGTQWNPFSHCKTFQLKSLGFHVLCPESWMLIIRHSYLFITCTKDQILHWSFLTMSKFSGELKSCIRSMFPLYLLVLVSLFVDSITNSLNGHQLVYCLLSYVNVLDIEKQPDVSNNHRQMLRIHLPNPNVIEQEHNNLVPLGVSNTYIWTKIKFALKIISTLRRLFRSDYVYLFHQSGVQFIPSLASSGDDSHL